MIFSNLRAQLRAALLADLRPPSVSWSRADIRSGAVRPQYDGMLALAEHARTLCWSRGQHIYLETYRADRRAHYANQFMFSQTRRPVVSLHVQHPASQPRPAPASPPRELQVSRRREEGTREF